MLPDSVMDLGDYIFKDCISLHTIFFPENLMYTGYCILEGCISLEEILIPKGTRSEMQILLGDKYEDILVEISNSSNSSEYGYCQPQYYENDTSYAHSVKELFLPTFSDIRELSVDYVNAHKGKLDGLFEKLNHGINIIKTQEELYVYMYCFGQMHEAKLRRAFNEIPKNFFRFNRNIEVIDYACGQGLATLCLNDYIEEEQFETVVKRITLIDPSKKALSRAALHCQTVLPESQIVTLLTSFDDMDYDDIDRTNLTRIHLLSNILDMDCYNLKNLADIIHEIVNKGDIFICVDPWYHNPHKDGRQQRFMKILNGSIIYKEAFSSGQFVENKTWTANITVFKI